MAKLVLLYVVLHKDTLSKNLLTTLSEDLPYNLCACKGAEILLYIIMAAVVLTLLRLLFPVYFTLPMLTFYFLF